MADRARARSSTGAGRPLAIFALAIFMFAAGGFTTWWLMTEGGLGPTASPSPSPEVAAAPTPAPPAAPSPSPLPSTTTASTPDAAPVAGAVPPPPAAGAPAARPRTARRRTATPVPARVGDGLSPADQALKIDPANPQARAGRSGRRFVTGTTAVESLKGVGRDLEGFQNEGVGVKRAPAVEGELELTMEPGELVPGRPYVVKIYLRNRGKRGIEIDDMKVSTVVDGKWTTRPLPPKMKEVGPQQRVLLEELPGLWKDEVKSWEMEVVVSSKSQDVYRNKLSWQ